MSSKTFTNKERTKWKILSFSLIGILIGSATTIAVGVFFLIPEQILNGPVTDQQVINAPSIVNRAYGAGTLTNVFALSADNIFSTKTYYTIAFTTATAGAIKEIEVTFPAGFNVANAKLLQVQGIGAGSLSVSGQVIKYTASSAVSIPASTTIKVSIADIINSAITSNQILVSIKAVSGPNLVLLDGPTPSAPFTLTQVTNGMIANAAIDGTKIRELADNSISGRKIIDGSIGKADLSFIRKVTIPDQNTGTATEWDPNGLRKYLSTTDSGVKDDSVILITLFGDANHASCTGLPIVGPDGHASRYIDIECNRPPTDGAILTYVLIN